MIRPVQFAYNAETAVNNSFQVASPATLQVQEKALAEFDAFVQVLRDHHIAVTVVQDTPEPHTPDSIFPNNWISFHENGTICLYPMFAENRRKERKQQVLDTIRQQFTITNTIDLTDHEHADRFLEGTGSMVLDREHRIAYACLSPRTDSHVLQAFCKAMDYQAITFTAVDSKEAPIYHTNVMMCVASQYVIICLDCIPDAQERAQVTQAIISSGKVLIIITREQVNHFAGNMLQVYNQEGQPYLVMSEQAYTSLTQEQLHQINQYNPIIHSSLNTIETNGGGSARCMMAEVFLPAKHPK